MLTSLSIGSGGLGRFGNQLFTIAGTIGIAIHSSQPYAFPHWRNHDAARFGDPVDDMDEFFINPLPRLDMSLDFTPYGYFWEYKDINLPAGNWDMNAHFQSIRYFDHCLPLIKHYFRMKNEYSPVDAIALHYRAGDYIKGDDNYHPRMSKIYYEKALSCFDDNMKVVVFSDDPEEAMQILGESDRFYYRHDKHYMDDFRMMKACKHFITANSSFSHMAALLGDNPDKKIVMPKLWFGKAANGLSFDSLYPLNAIVI